MAVVLAAMATFFAAPTLFHLTIEFVLEFAAANYGRGFLGAVPIGWAALIAALTFFATQMTFDTAVFSFIFAIALRFF